MTCHKVLYRQCAKRGGVCIFKIFSSLHLEFTPNVIMKQLKQLSILLLFCWSSLPLFGQAVITGTIVEAETQLPLSGVEITVSDRLSSTITDDSGFFTLITNSIPPFKIELSLFGFKDKVVNVVQQDQVVNVEMSPAGAISDELVVTASKIVESELRVPITVERVNAKDILLSPQADAYNSLRSLKGVQLNTGSLSFTSLNTRGFGTMQNWRFIQLVDGMEMNTPGLNYPVGGNSSASDLDIKGMELVPGAGSALYGANAFNGMLAIQTKDPFYEQGLSAELQGGVTMQDAQGTQPFGRATIRYAKAFKDRFAFKVVLSGFSATDWAANNTDFHITPRIVAEDAVDAFQSIPESSPFYNAVNVYGDETALLVNLGDTTRLVSRTGYAEQELVDYGIENYKIHTKLAYRITSNLEMDYEFRYHKVDAVLRHTAIYPLVNLDQHWHKLTLRNKAFTWRSYYTREDAGEAYNAQVLANYIQEASTPSPQWAAAYGAAYRGEVSGVTGANHASARAYADAGVAQPGSDLFNTLRQQSLNNAEIRTGGSRLVSNSSLLHSEAQYDFSKHWSVVDFLVGGNVRRFELNSGGALFNDGPTGFDAPIGILEYGGFVQASKRLLNDGLLLRASGRYDKNQNFEGRFTPRVATVISLGKTRNHNIRAAYQTGFRNPASQETYIGLDVGEAILLGGIEENINNYNYINPATGTAIPGTTIHPNLVTLPSLAAFSQTGDSSLLELANIALLSQEKISSIELGYKAIIQERFSVDINYYYSVYRDFVSRVEAYSLEAGRVFSVYTNIPERITAQGGGVSLSYALTSGYRVFGNYSFALFDAEEATTNNPNFLPAFNTPPHRFNIGVSNPQLVGNLGFSLEYRWSDSYLWQSPFGQGEIPSYQVLDATLLYQLPKTGMSIKLGGTNLLFQEYLQVYGGPFVGSQLYVGVRYNPGAYPKNNLLNRAKKSKKPADTENTPESGGGNYRF